MNTYVQTKNTHCVVLTGPELGYIGHIGHIPEYGLLGHLTFDIYFVYAGYQVRLQMITGKNPSDV